MRRFATAFTWRGTTAVLLVSCVVFLTAGTTTQAGERIGLPAVQVMSVIDGDTIRVRAMVALGAIDQDRFVRWMPVASQVVVRIAGIDAPEIRDPDCPAELALGLRAARHLASLVDRSSGLVQLHDVGFDRYGGRFVASVRLTDGTDVGQAMLDGGFVVPIDIRGGRRHRWCAAATEE
ncbi:MAG: thermonuclease family protein [Candidatus Binatia bacterium]|nr:thermonuclease family protein [Candidatus Binatia bacterium]